MTASTSAFIPSPPSNGLHLGPLFIHAYGLAYLLAVIAAVAITTRRWEARCGRRQLVYEVALWGLPAGLIGGRLYFLATSWNEVPAHWWGPLAVWKGGLGIWGGIAAGTLAGLWVLRRRGADIPAFLDAAAPALLVAQAIGRVGNYFNQELFGGPTTLPWALQISPAHRPSGNVQHATFHPTFLYELIWNLLLVGALAWLGRRRSIRAPGLFALYVAGYSFVRIGEELLRVDPAPHILGLRLNLYVASILCLAGVAWFARIQRSVKIGSSRAVRRGGALLAAGGALAIAGCGHTSRASAAPERSSASVASSLTSAASISASTRSHTVVAYRQEGGLGGPKGSLIVSANRRATATLGRCVADLGPDLPCWFGASGLGAEVERREGLKECLRHLRTTGVVVAHEQDVLHRLLLRASPSCRDTLANGSTISIDERQLH